MPLDARFDAAFIAQLVEYDPLRRSPPPALTVDERIAVWRLSIAKHLDAAAQARGYDSIHTAVTYADEPAVPRFQGEGKSLRAWRSLVWATAYEILDAVQLGQMEEPSFEALIALLPEAPSNS